MNNRWTLVKLQCTCTSTTNQLTIIYKRVHGIIEQQCAIRLCNSKCINQVHLLIHWKSETLRLCRTRQPQCCTDCTSQGDRVPPIHLPLKYCRQLCLVVVVLAACPCFFFLIVCQVLDSTWALRLSKWNSSQQTWHGIGSRRCHVCKKKMPQP